MTWSDSHLEKSIGEETEGKRGASERSTGVIQARDHGDLAWSRGYGKGEKCVDLRDIEPIESA